VVAVGGAAVAGNVVRSCVHGGAGRGHGMVQAPFAVVSRKAKRVQRERKRAARVIQGVFRRQWARRDSPLKGASIAAQLIAEWQALANGEEEEESEEEEGEGEREEGRPLREEESEEEADEMRSTAQRAVDAIRRSIFASDDASDIEDIDDRQLTSRRRPPRVTVVDAARHPEDFATWPRRGQRNRGHHHHGCKSSLA